MMRDSIFIATNGSNCSLLKTGTLEKSNFQVEDSWKSAILMKLSNSTSLRPERIDSLENRPKSWEKLGGGGAKKSY